MPVQDTVDFRLTIDGQAHDTQNTFAVVNPSTGETVAHAPEASKEQVDEAFRAAAHAFPAWSSEEDPRRRALREAAGVLAGAAERIAPTLTAEQGKPLRFAVGEILGAAAWLTYYADLDAPATVLQDDAHAYAEARLRPLGVVAAITPWNFPVYIAMAKVAMALRAGNTVVLKPSPYTPLSTLQTVSALADVLPAGVLNVVTGSDRIAPWVTRHPLVRKISFTGSTATGRRIAQAAAASFTPLTLEMGGNDPAVVLDDADVRHTADRLFAAAFDNCGQACVAPKRVYADRRIHADLVDALAERARAARIGDGMDPETEFGPLNNRAQRDRVADLVEDAVDRGATLVTGGRAPAGRGWFYEPTIVTGVSNGIRLVDEEQFGPVLPVMSFDGIDEAVRLANDTSFGLGASVWGADTARASDVARRLEAGNCWVNTHVALAPHQPFAGWKSSGVGIEGGHWGLESFSAVQLAYRTDL
ncbi:aldehyde dehydrogenase family protein [Streptomyces sp. NPDC026672]|uniref:aldehyde dehydrogenase family protein n=1 Tax=unclassified Streptomyces TaxID=2593676 RepID=UPI00340991BF